MTIRIELGGTAAAAHFVATNILLLLACVYTRFAKYRFGAINRLCFGFRFGLLIDRVLADRVVEKESTLLIDLLDILQMTDYLQILTEIVT